MADPKKPITETKEKKSPNKNKWLAGLGLAGLAGAGYLLSGGDDVPSPNSLTPSTHAPENPDAIQGNLSTDKPSFTDRLDSGKPQREAVAGTRKKIGVLIDVDVENFNKYQIVLEANEDGTTTVKAVPIIIRGEREIIYTLPDSDPLNSLANKTNKKIVAEALEEWRNGYRQGQQEDIDKTNSRHGKNSAITIPDIGWDWDNTFIVGTVPKNSDLVLRIDLGSENSSLMGWLKNVSTTPQELPHEIDEFLGYSDSMVNFLREATINPQSGKFDQNAKETIKRMFSLTPEDRAVFMREILDGNITEAKQILTFRSAINPLTEDIFQSLLKYKQLCHNNGISSDHIRNGLIAITSLTYPELGDPDALEDVAKETALLKQAFSQSQYTQLEKIPEQLINIIAEYISAEATPSYLEFKKKLSDAIMAPQKKNPTHTLDGTQQPDSLPELLPEHMKNSLQMIFAGNPDQNILTDWFSRTDRYRNMLSAMGLLELRSKIAEESENTGTRLNEMLNGLIHIKAGKACALVRIDTHVNAEQLFTVNQDVPKDEQTSLEDLVRRLHARQTNTVNNKLDYLRTLLGAASSQLPIIADILQRTRTLSAPEKASLYFAQDPNSAYVSSIQHLRSFAHIVQDFAISPEDIDGFVSPNSNSSIRITDEKVVTHGFAIHDIERVQAHSKETNSVQRGR